jgi:hypothetical protein
MLIYAAQAYHTYLIWKTRMCINVRRGNNMTVFLTSWLRDEYTHIVFVWFPASHFDQEIDKADCRFREFPVPREYLKVYNTKPFQMNAYKEIQDVYDTLNSQGIKYTQTRPHIHTYIHHLSEVVTWIFIKAVNQISQYSTLLTLSPLYTS